MAEDIVIGTQRLIEGRSRVYYDGYWIKAYEAPANSLLEKKRLIEALTRRLFNHVEHGLNVPGDRLDEARAAYRAETDPRRQRVKAAMLAGALFNRAAAMFTKLVEIQALGVEIHADNELMRECGEHLQEALTLGKTVLHRSGEEGIDELWGEPFKAFAFPIAEFYRSRYVKIALTMRAIDQIATHLDRTVGALPAFAGLGALIADFATAAKSKAETLRTDTDIFDVWTSFVVSAERLAAFEPRPSPASLDGAFGASSRGLRLVLEGRDLISYVARARVPMPKSTRALIERCAAFERETGETWEPGQAVDENTVEPPRTRDREAKLASAPVQAHSPSR